MTVRWFEQSLADVPVLNDWLNPWESSRLSGLRVPKRRTDWRLGRWTAKCAVADCLGLSRAIETLATIEIRPQSSGAPEVFIEDAPADISISLSHSAGLAACLVGAPGIVLGCDVELIEPRTDTFVGDYFTSDEQLLIRNAAEADRCALATLIWSAKESALKALRTGLRSDTHCVSVTFHDDVQRMSIVDDQSPICVNSPGFAGRSELWHPLNVNYAGTNVFDGCWLCKDQFVRTLVCIRTDGALSSHGSNFRGLLNHLLL